MFKLRLEFALYPLKSVSEAGFFMKRYEFWPIFLHDRIIGSEEDFKDVEEKEENVHFCFRPSEKNIFELVTNTTMSSAFLDYMN